MNNSDINNLFNFNVLNISPQPFSNQIQRSIQKQPQRYKLFYYSQTDVDVFFVLCRKPQNSTINFTLISRPVR